MHEQTKDMLVRIKASSPLIASVYGPFCEVHFIPFTCKDKKHWPIKEGLLSSCPYVMFWVLVMMVSSDIQKTLKIELFKELAC